MDGIKRNAATQERVTDSVRSGRCLGCDKRAQVRGLCAACDARWRRKARSLRSAKQRREYIRRLIAEGHLLASNEIRAIRSRSPFDRLARDVDG